MKQQKELKNKNQLSENTVIMSSYKQVLAYRIAQAKRRKQQKKEVINNAV